jgi:hypothetical protein
MYRCCSRNEKVSRKFEGKVWDSSQEIDLKCNNEKNRKEKMTNVRGRDQKV